jgi:fatty-acyl-CoA synthase
VHIAQVVAAPDARYGEVAAAFVELDAQAEITERELIDFCIGQISTFKVPRYVRFVTAWPMSGTKIKKVDLRTRIAAELEAANITEAPPVQTARGTDAASREAAR